MKNNFETYTFIQHLFILNGFYDLILGIGILFFSEFLIKFFDVRTPDSTGMIYVRLAGIFLLFFAYLQFYSSQDVLRMAFIGFGIAFVRFGFTILIFFLWLTQGVEVAYIFISFIDTFMGLSLIIPLLLTKGISWKQILFIRTS